MPFQVLPASLSAGPGAALAAAGRATSRTGDAGTSNAAGARPVAMPGELRWKARWGSGPGDLGLIPGGVEHEAWFPEDTDVIDVFAPPRQDFLTSEVPAYMRKG